MAEIGGIGDDVSHPSLAPRVRFHRSLEARIRRRLARARRRDLIRLQKKYERLNPSSSHPTISLLRDAT